MRADAGTAAALGQAGAGAAMRGSARGALAVSGGMKTKPLAFSVHLLTGSGAALALMALVAATPATGG